LSLGGSSLTLVEMKWENWRNEMDRSVGWVHRRVKDTSEEADDV
jgi:hypothetical protein